MSLIEIIHHNEEIYSILDKPPPERPKTPRYESKLEKELKATKIPKQHKMFGYAETPLRPPSNFLKKGKGMPQPVIKSDHQCCETDHLPPLPKTLPVKTKKGNNETNFKVRNINNAVKAKSKPFEPKLVDSRDGNINKLKGSGKIPEYALGKDFGRVPDYLMKRNRRIWKEFEKLRVAEEKRESLCKLISEEERQQLLNDLKHKWEVKQKAFLQLPIMTDTIPKILKKTKMEQELKELEKHISFIDSNPYIYVYE